MRPALNVWTGQTVHARFQPFARRFAYRLVLIDIDIDRLAEADAASPLFSVNRPGLFSFYDADHGARAKGSLRSWADTQFAKAGVDVQAGSIRLVTFPRHLFYKFAPLSLWYGYAPTGDLRGVIYEVNNTFGESHVYVAAVNAARSQHAADKAFHVSPFFDVTGEYRFTLRAPEDSLDVVVESLEGTTRLHMANIKAKRAAASSSNFLRFALTNPLSTFGVTFAIHWQALKLWLKGARYRSKPAPPERDTTIATALPNSVSTKDAA